MNICTIDQKINKIKWKRKPINIKTNYPKGMKLIPINIYFCLLQFDALKFFLGDLLHEVSLPNFIFFFQYKPLNLTALSLFLFFFYFYSFCK